MLAYNSNLRDAATADSVYWAILIWSPGHVYVAYTTQERVCVSLRSRALGATKWWQICVSHAATDTKFNNHHFTGFSRLLRVFLLRTPYSMFIVAWHITRDALQDVAFLLLFAVRPSDGDRAPASSLGWRMTSLLVGKFVKCWSRWGRRVKDADSSVSDISILACSLHRLQLRQWSFLVVRPWFSRSNPNFSKHRSRTANYSDFWTKSRINSVCMLELIMHQEQTNS